MRKRELRIENLEREILPGVIEFVVAFESMYFCSLWIEFSNFARNERWMMEIEDLEIESWEFEASVCMVSWNFSFRGNRVQKYPSLFISNLIIYWSIDSRNWIAWRSNIFLLYLSSMPSLFTINFVSMWNISRCVITLIQFRFWFIHVFATLNVETIYFSSFFLFFFSCLQFLPAPYISFLISCENIFHITIFYRKR